jgi:poly[(R)-3-hydroxyalkanoate] polymerase subunit PhaC
MPPRISDADSWPGVTPCEHAADTDAFNLYAFEAERGRVGYPVVIVYSTVNRAYILDFHPQLSVIKRFLDAGLNVYMIDWKHPRSAALGLAEYAEDALGHAIDIVRRRTGAEAVQLVGYCWGGLFAAIHAARHSDTVASLTLLATPVDFEAEPLSTIELWLRRSGLNPDRLADQKGFVSGDIVRQAVTLANPVQMTLVKWYELVDCGHDAGLVNMFFQGQRWAYDTPLIAGKLFGEVIRNIYQNNELAREKLKVRGTPVRLGAITCPVLSIVADHDHSVSPAGSLRIGDLVATKPHSVHSFRVRTGHFGLCASVKTHTDVWPKVAHLLASV